MAAVIPNLVDGVYQFTLTSDNNTCDLDLSQMIQSGREFVVGNASAFNGGVLKIYRWLSSNTDWTPYVQPFSPIPLSINAAGSGYGLQFLHRAGKIRFSLEGASVGASVPIDIFR